MHHPGLASTVDNLLHVAALRHSHKTALVFEGQRWTYGSLEDAVLNVAGHLQSLGLGAGHAISLIGPNTPEWVIAYHAVLRIGAIVNPLNLMLTPPEAAYAIADCGATAVIGADDRLAPLASALDGTSVRLRLAFGGQPPPHTNDFHRLLQDGAALFKPVEISPDQVCTVGYTSGTTGHPKGATLTHRAITLNTAMTATMHVRTQADTVVSALPCSHVYGNVVMNAALACGMTLVLHRSFDVERVLASIETERATLFEGVPTMYHYILNHPQRHRYDLSSLTRCTVGGQTMPVTKMREVEAVFGCPLIELWGMTELGGLGTTHSLYGPRRLGSIGVPLPHLEARVVATDGSRRVLPPGDVGELQIRGPVTMKGYLGQPLATAEALEPDGWLHTGDLVRQDNDGYLFVVDRLKDLIITGGFNIYPAELERAIAEHPDVAMVAVGSVPDEDKGELAKAYVVPRPGARLDIEALDQHCRQRLAAYKVPRLYQLVEDLPKTSTGKVLRRRLRELDAVS